MLYESDGRAWPLAIAHVPMFRVGSTNGIEDNVMSWVPGADENRVKTEIPEL